MRCVRCHGLMVVDENRSVDNDLREVNGMRCVNCGCFAPTVTPSVRMSQPRLSSHPSPLAGERRRRPAA